MATSPISLTFRTLGLSTVESDCKRLIRPEVAKRGRTTTSSEARFFRSADSQNSLFAQVKLSVEGKSSEPPELISFTVNIIIETEVQFENKAPNPEQLSHETAKAIFEPLFYTVLERARQCIWQLGYSGVRLPIKPFVLENFSKASSPAQPAKKKRATKSKSS